MTDTKFVHLALDGKLKATIAYEVDGDEVFYGWAACHPSDNFSRSMGRKIAASRLNSISGKSFVLEPGARIIESVMEHILKSRAWEVQNRKVVYPILCEAIMQSNWLSISKSNDDSLQKNIMATAE